MSDKQRLFGPRRLFLAIALPIALLGGGAAYAQNALDVRTVVQKEQVEVGDDGETTTTLVSAERVLPGDTVVYTITFTNTGDAPADNVVVTNPIDDSLTYVEGSAFGAGMRVEFSADSGQSFAARDAVMVTESGVERAAEAEDVTHVRWTLEGSLDAGATGVARFSATVD